MMENKEKELLDFDHNHLWHPYSALGKEENLFPVKSAKGVYLELFNGDLLLDGMASWWSVIHGYNHPILNAALKRQVDSMSHVMFGGLTHEPAVELGRKLVELLPDGLDKLFYADSGSVAVEVAMKMAIQYWYCKGRPEKSRFAALKKAYHGDTWHAMSVCDPVTGMHSIFSETLPEQIFIPEPPMGFDVEIDSGYVDGVRQIICENHDSLAAFIVEPIVQGAGGMRVYNPAYLNILQGLCKEYDLLFICDEIATGFGRTGKMFAVNHAGVVPDIICLGKGLTGGYMTMGCVATNENIATTLNEKDPGVFMHGPTFMANPLACAVSAASLDILSKYEIEPMIAEIQHGLSVGFSPLKIITCVQDVRTMGAIGVIEMRDQVDIPEIQKRMVKEGIWLRPFGKLIYVMPAFIISQDALKFLTGKIVKVICEFYHEK
ncbi:MAG: adenosylmethionine--8-amino-7-oxononanoate transaminase [Marinilabiliales bacterium]|nr:MAG: adenosylmethionine--8-amino-7-oxononanoate transaminase [Marinilabiliales bacterium]